MAKLRFTFGTMGSGKSTQALQIHHNLRARGLTTLLMTQLDRREGRVSSRLGVSADAEIVEPSSDPIERQHPNLHPQLQSLHSSFALSTLHG